MMPGLRISHAEPCWVDLMSSDPERAQDFYGRLFGWQTAPDGPGEDGYQQLLLDGRPVGGLLYNDQGDECRDAWTTYLNVVDIHAAVFSAKLHGGSVYLEPLHIEGQGFVAMIGDPAGDGVGLWQADEAEDFRPTGQPGTRIWSELHTKVFGAASRFYHEALGWEMNTLSDTAEFRYQSYGVGAEAKAGIFDVSANPQASSGWRTYFAVANTDASVALAVKSGAAVVREAQDSPFGRMAVLADPMGAELSIIQSASR